MFTDRQVNQLKRIHAELMDRMTYQTDLEKFKVVDYWEGAAAIRPSGSFRGDCEEFSMLAVMKARQLGLNARLVVCRDETGEGHCIAEVADPKLLTSYFFDNRQRRLVTLKELAHYRFYSVSPWNPLPGDTRPWVRVATSH